MNCMKCYFNSCTWRKTTKNERFNQIYNGIYAKISNQLCHIYSFLNTNIDWIILLLFSTECSIDLYWIMVNFAKILNILNFALCRQNRERYYSTPLNQWKPFLLLDAISRYRRSNSTQLHILSRQILKNFFY